MTPAQDLYNKYVEWATPLVENRSRLTQGVIREIEGILDLWAHKWSYPREKVRVIVESYYGRINIVVDDSEDLALHIDRPDPVFTPLSWQINL